MKTLEQEATQIWQEARDLATHAQNRMTAETHIRWLSERMEKVVEKRSNAKAKVVARKLFAAERDDLNEKVRYQRAQAKKAKDLLAKLKLLVHKAVWERANKEVSKDEL